MVFHTMYFCLFFVRDVPRRARSRRAIGRRAAMPPKKKAAPAPVEEEEEEELLDYDEVADAGVLHDNFLSRWE